MILILTLTHNIFLNVLLYRLKETRWLYLQKLIVSTSYGFSRSFPYSQKNSFSTGLFEWTDEKYVRTKQMFHIVVDNCDDSIEETDVENFLQVLKNEFNAIT